MNCSQTIRIRWKIAWLRSFADIGCAASLQPSLYGRCQTFHWKRSIRWIAEQPHQYRGFLRRIYGLAAGWVEWTISACTMAENSGVRDEIRLISPGFYLGRVFWKKDLVLYFTPKFWAGMLCYGSYYRRLVEGELTPAKHADFGDLTFWRLDNNMAEIVQLGASWLYLGMLSLVASSAVGKVGFRQRARDVEKLESWR